jgi:hypothetical protein
MALHGLIQVNDQPIGAWSAVRVAEGADGIYRYRCEVQVNHGIPRRFYVLHRYSDGAVALAAKVLTAASPAPQPTEEA